MNNYEAALDTVSGWIAAGTGLTLNESLFNDPSLPEGPDRVAALYESGGTWDSETNLTTLNAELLVRAASLNDARKFVRQCTAAAMGGFQLATTDARGSVRDVRCLHVPSNKGRDEMGRVHLALPLTVTLYQTEADLEAQDCDG